MARDESRSGGRPVTLSDVARLAGVSVATASKALNGRDQVAPATRAKVIDAADRLSFSPNPLARGLLAGRTGTVGLLTSDLEGRFVIPILMGAEDAFGAGQVNVFVCDARGDAIREQHHLRALLSRRVDGIIVVGRQTDPRPSLGQELPVPVVYAYAPSDDPEDLSLTPDNRAAGVIAVEHLLSTGRTRIAHISGDPSYAAAQDRAIGVRERLAEAGLDLVGDVMFSDWSEHWGRDAAGLVLEQHPDVDAIVCGSDQIARGALDTCRDLGRVVPDDIAVMGFDNWEVLTTNARPELTSIDANLQQLGRTAAQRVFAALDGVDVGSGVHHLPSRLVIRGSTVPRR
jgi:LacI family transcriptional regulator